VGGVSWYEAAAYAEFAHKSLPTVYHWYWAAGIGITSQIIPWSNFIPRDHERWPDAWTGALWELRHGRQRERVDGEQVQGEALHCGRRLERTSYMFQQGDVRSPWDREATFGFRCAQYVAEISEKLKGEVVKDERNRRGEPPVDDRGFQAFKETLSYKKTEVKVLSRHVDNAPLRWRREDITFPRRMALNRSRSTYTYPRMPLLHIRRFSTARGATCGSQRIPTTSSAASRTRLSGPGGARPACLLRHPRIAA
jgi:hypothetical protein